MRASAYEGRRLVEDWAPAAARRPRRLAPTAASLRLGAARRGGTEAVSGGRAASMDSSLSGPASPRAPLSHPRTSGWPSRCARAQFVRRSSIRYFRVTKQYSVMCYCYACSLWWAAVRWCIRRTTLTSTKGRPRRLSPDRRPSRPFRSMTG